MKARKILENPQNRTHGPKFSFIRSFQDFSFTPANLFIYSMQQQKV